MAASFARHRTSRAGRIGWVFLFSSAAFERRCEPKTGLPEPSATLGLRAGRQQQGGGGTRRTLHTRRGCPAELRAGARAAAGGIREAKCGSHQEAAGSGQDGMSRRVAVENRSADRPRHGKNPVAPNGPAKTTTFLAK